jgi:ATP-dependent DNA helicase RecG
LTEGKNTGFRKIRAAMKYNGSPKPVFITDEEYLRSLNLNERQIKAVMYIKEKGQITNKEYQEVCATSKRTASMDLLDLVSSGFFEQIGTTGTGTGLWMTWILTLQRLALKGTGNW